MGAADGRSALFEQFARAVASGAPEAERSRILVEALASMVAGPDGRSLLLEQFARAAVPGADEAERSRLAASLLTVNAPGADGRSALLEQLVRARPAEGAGGAPQPTVADLLASLLAAPEGRSALLQQLARPGGTAGTIPAQPDRTRAPVPSKELVPGMVVGRFEMVKEIGRGGFGVVFEARDRDLGRSVAFKAVRPGVRTRQLDTMLLQEAESAARLQHENIVSIFDYGQSDAGPYLVLELLKGETLAGRLARGPMAVNEVVHVGIQVSRALAHAHGAGLLHRDLKPGNVFLTQSGGVKVMDLGLAHFFGQPTGLSGTPAYMAPEQWKGEAQDGRTDVFALGVTLFEMLGALRPYEVRSDRSTVLDPGPEPKLVAHHVPARLKKLVERCIAKDPAKRPASARAVQEELLAVERGLATGEARKGQLFLVMVLGGVLAVVGAAGVAAYKFWPRQVVKGAPRTVLVADFDNRTGEEVFNGTLEPTVGLTLEGAAFISAYSRGSAKRVADQLKLAGTGLPEARARLVAQREGIATVVSGFVEKDGTGYRLGARSVDAFSGKKLLEKIESATDHGGVLAAASKLAAKVRVSLGDSTPESTLLKEAETFSATSLEAAHEYSVANDLALTQGKYQEAQKHYLEAIRLDPGMGRAYTGLAVMEANRGQGAEAEAHFQKGLTLVDRMTEREKFRTRGSYYMFKRDADKAIEAYEGLVKQFPADNAGLANLGLAYVFKGDFARALDYTRKALALYPQNVPQRNNAGYFAMYAGDFPVALQDQQQVLRLNPGFVNGYIGLALAQEASGARDEAVATWKTLSALGPSEASSAVEGLADLAVLEGRLGDARALLEKGIQDDLGQKDNAGAARKLVMLAGVHLSLGEGARAADAASRAAALSQQDYVQYLAARVLVDAGQEKRALSIADGLGKRFEAAPRVYAELIHGAVALQRRNPTEAIARFKAGQKLLDMWLVRYELGRAYLAAGAPAQAQDELEASARRQGEVTDVFVDNVPTYRLLGPVLYWKARAQEAQKSPAAAESYRAFLATKKTNEDPLVVDARKRLAAL
jgi:tetratricopeptide (TPR) repeat protein